MTEPLDDTTKLIKLLQAATTGEKNLVDLIAEAAARLEATLKVAREGWRYAEELEQDRKRQAEEIERLRIGHDRYETVRRMHVQQFQDAFILNLKTGKPFDEIIDGMKPFVQPAAQRVKG